MNELVSGRGFVAGGPNTGAGETARRIVSALLGTECGLVVLDVSGRFAEFRADHRVVSVGDSGALTPELAGSIAATVLETGRAAVLDLSRAERIGPAILATVAEGLSPEEPVTPRGIVVIDRLQAFLPAGAEVCADALRSMTRQGVGLLGVTNSPQQLPRHFAAGADWAVWHRLPQPAEESVLEGIDAGIDPETLGELPNEEALLQTGWSGTVRRVRFDRRPWQDRELSGPPTPDSEVDPSNVASDGAVSPHADLPVHPPVVDRLSQRIERVERSVDRLFGARGSGRPDDDATAVTDPSPARVEPALSPPSNALENGSRPPVSDDGTGVADVFSAFDDTGDAVQSDGRSSTAGDADVGPPNAGDRDVARAAGPDGEATAATDRLDPEKPAHVRRFVRELRGLDERGRAMLVHYHENGPSTPIAAHLESGGPEDRNAAYCHNRTLRRGGYIQHIGRGKYVHRLGAVLADRATVSLDRTVHRQYVDWVVEQAAPA